MSTEARLLWRGPRWALAVLLAGLSMLGPFTVDTYLPAFGGIAASLGATPLQMQQTLSAYLLGFSLTNLFHGALADSFGRRPVVLGGLAVFTLASVGCAMSDSIALLVAFRMLQGMSAGAGMVVSRAIIRDMFAEADAQRVMAQVTIFFGIAPAIAPMIGGFLYGHAAWPAIFWFLALLGGGLWLANWRLLPETLTPASAQAFDAGNLLRGYWGLARNRRFLALCLASGVPFNGVFLYVLSAPVFLGELLKLAPTQFFWFFTVNVSGIMAGAWLSGRLAGRIHRHRQVRHGFVVMLLAALANLGLSLTLEPHLWWAVPPIAAYSLGWAMSAPVITLTALDLSPARRGMASSVQSTLASLVNALVAGVISPLVMHSMVGLAAASLVMLIVGLAAWRWVKPRVITAA